MSYTGSDIYCDLIIPRKVAISVLAETENILAYYHTKPYWEVHVVVTPKRHVDSVLTVDNNLLVELMDVVKSVAGEVLEKHKEASIVTNLGKFQDSKHLHIHIRAGEVLQKV